MQMERRKRTAVRLRHLKVSNFKALDEFEMEFPVRELGDDPDVVVMGSRNGLGKTSVLESCALLFLAGGYGEKVLHLERYPEMPLDFGDLLVRAGQSKASIEGVFQMDKSRCRICLNLSRKEGVAKVEGDSEQLQNLFRESLRLYSDIHPAEMAQRFLFSLAGVSAEPLLLPHLLYFHSYRKVQEGNPELGMMVEGRHMRRRYRPGPYAEFPISLFKLEILRSMMGRADLFEHLEEADADKTLKALNDLVERYSGGRIGKLRPFPDNTVDIRIHPRGGKGSHPFDGLSSGQKEIISTLFLIWRYSSRTPGVILIDEPELHLNAEWHRDFIRQACAMAPGSQFVVATHSEDVFDSVSKDRRWLLEAGQEGKR